MSYKHILTAQARDQFFRYLLPIMGIYIFVFFYIRRFDFSPTAFQAEIFCSHTIGPCFTADSVQELARAYYLAHGFSLYDQIAYNSHAWTCNHVLFGTASAWF